RSMRRPAWSASSPATSALRSQPGVGSAFRIVLPLESPGNLGGAHGN
ncbi:hypothetical protein ACLBVB_35525, partial [Pseudomonas aeruginosa]